jgi:glycosyltransferase involved in cell wall biosynthesis
VHPSPAYDATASADTPGDLAELRVLIVHDWITSWAGSERVVEQLLALFPRADLVVGVLDARAVPRNEVTTRASETWLRHVPLARRHHRWFLPAYPAAFAAIDTSGYDIVVSSAHAFAKCVRVARGTPHVCYCHSPPRYLWDLQSTYRRGAGVVGAMLGVATPVLRKVDVAAARRVDHFVANSHFIADRIARTYGRRAAVVYPPVSPKSTPVWRGARDEALLSFGRLVPYKRVDLAIRAANALRKPLLVAGDGPERARLEALAGPTVRFLGEVSEERAGELLERCSAMIFCAEEDFGIAPVEANAHGMPVVAFGRGAIRETMQEGATAVFFDAQTPEAVSAAVAQAVARPWDDASIRANAARFSPDRFRTEFAEQLRRVLRAV